MEPNALAPWAAVATIITGFAAVAYTVGTFFLWWTTKKSLDAMQAGFKLNFLLAYRDAGGGGGIMARLVASQTDKVQAHALDRLLKAAFPKEYEALMVAMRGKPEVAP